jgi:hypothetical protein
MTLLFLTERIVEPADKQGEAMALQVSEQW